VHTFLLFSPLQYERRRLKEREEETEDAISFTSSCQKRERERGGSFSSFIFPSFSSSFSSSFSQNIPSKTKEIRRRLTEKEVGTTMRKLMGDEKRG
jgi:hypothetical protein